MEQRPDAVDRMAMERHGLDLGQGPGKTVRRQ
jgi:hypothetical protein